MADRPTVDLPLTATTILPDTCEVCILTLYHQDFYFTFSKHPCRSVEFLRKYENLRKSYFLYTFFSFLFMSITLTLIFKKKRDIFVS